MTHPLQNKIDARRTVMDACYEEFLELCDMLGGEYATVGEFWEPCTPERGELLRETLRRYRPAMRAAWRDAE